MKACSPYVLSLCVFPHNHGHKMEISPESPQNDPEGTEITQGDNTYGEKAFIYVSIYKKVLRYPESCIYSHTKSMNLILKVKMPITNSLLGLPVFG